MSELLIATVGITLLGIALIRGGASTTTWFLTRLRLSRILTVAIVLLVVGALLAQTLGRAK
ncbi:hypothetical protein GCM10027280_26760 [Micromonospora polyrhachis]|uniref:Uncharacterized protein n=1 Tax=Micromonospora polyrhachis TaxID=1282883 RepID=A0A7W7WNE3_9ACTN|nr:hypothetical protein [Micromonospora polyrhachis]